MILSAVRIRDKKGGEEHNVEADIRCPRCKDIVAASLNVASGFPIEVYAVIRATPSWQCNSCGLVFQWHEKNLAHFWEVLDDQRAATRN